jgi:hypothetical protein
MSQQQMEFKIHSLQTQINQMQIQLNSMLTEVLLR